MMRVVQIGFIMRLVQINDEDQFYMMRVVDVLYDKISVDYYNNASGVDQFHIMRVCNLVLYNESGVDYFYDESVQTSSIMLVMQISSRCRLVRCKLIYIYGESGVDK